MDYIASTGLPFALRALALALALAAYSVDNQANALVPAAR